MDEIENEIVKLIAREGGYVNDPDDAGGETKWGITKGVYREQGYPGDVENMTMSTAQAIYRTIYWEEPKFDQVAEYSAELGYEMFDTGVNMGVTIPVKFLQRWLNGFNYKGNHWDDIKVDGYIGRKTLEALESFMMKRGRQAEHVMLAAMNCSQGAMYLSLTEHKITNEKFLWGWMSNRVEIK